MSLSNGSIPQWNCFLEESTSTQEGTNMAIHLWSTKVCIRTNILQSKFHCFLLISWGGTAWWTWHWAVAIFKCETENKAINSQIDYMSQNSETVVNSQGLTYTIESICQYQYFQIGREFVFVMAVGWAFMGWVEPKRKARGTVHAATVCMNSTPVGD